MKPTFQISRPARRGDSTQSFGSKSTPSPAVDWFFQSPALPLHGGVASLDRRVSQPSLLRSFRCLSAKFFASEAKRESRLEGALFAVIVALAAWPIVLAVQAASALVK